MVIFQFFQLLSDDQTLIYRLKMTNLSDFYILNLVKFDRETTARESI